MATHHTKKPTSQASRSKKTRAKSASVLSTNRASDAPIASPKSRRLHLPKRATKAEKQEATAVRAKIPAAHRLFITACEVLVRHWKLFGGILIVYALLTLVLVGGVSGGSDLDSIKKTVNNAFSGQWSQIGAGLTLFAFLIGSTGNSASAVSGAYQTMLLLLISVVLIWALRQVHAGHSVRVREAFYMGTYPIVPFILVLCVVGLGLIPLVIGTSLYGAVIGGGIAVTGLEKAVVLFIFLLSALLSVYLVCSSLLALYIVTLPDMTPMKALRAAKELVRFRRWVIFRKLLFLPIAVLVLMAIVVVPFALTLTALATIVFFVVSIAAVAIIHSYMYTLYRSLL